MKTQLLTFRELIAPITPEEFFADYYRKKPLHIPGPPEKFQQAFSWEALNDLLRMTSIWSDHNCELSFQGQGLHPNNYCYETINRDNVKSLRPDFDRVGDYLRQGATMTLNFIGRLSPELRSLTQTLEAVLGAPANISTFCSFQNSAGYPVHFDTTNVFACHIAGTKTWHVYEGRMLNAAHSPGGRSPDFPQSHHEEAKGAVLHEVHMTPGDLLYLPHGQYHDAIATSDAALHISCAVRHMVAHDFITRLAGDLPDDPLFREHLPHLDKVAQDSAYRQRIADRLQQIILDPSVGQDLKGFLHGKAFEGEAAFDLPGRQKVVTFRVAWLGRELQQADGAWSLQGQGPSLALMESEARLVEWLLERDLFTVGDLKQAFADRPVPELQQNLAKLQQAGLVEAM